MYELPTSYDDVSILSIEVGGFEFQCRLRWSQPLAMVSILSIEVGGFEFVPRNGESQCGYCFNPLYRGGGIRITATVEPPAKTEEFQSSLSRWGDSNPGLTRLIMTNSGVSILSIEVGGFE